MITISHFKKLRVWYLLICSSVILLSVPYLTFLSFDGHLIEKILQVPHKAVLLFGLVGAWVAAFVAGVRVVAIAYQVFFDNYRAIWVDGETLIYLRRSVFCVPKANIENISLGLIGRAGSPAISVQLRDGTRKSIPTRSLEQSQDEILRRLETILNVPVFSADVDAATGKAQLPK